MTIVAIGAVVFSSQLRGAENVAVDEAGTLDVANATDYNCSGDENIDVADDASKIEISWHQYRVSMSMMYIISLGSQDATDAVATF